MKWWDKNWVDHDLEHWFQVKDDSEIAPSDHYFHTFLSFSLLERGEQEKGIAVLKHYLTLENKGHAEFNLYALLRIYQHHGEILEKEHLQADVLLLLKEVVFSVNTHTDTGNNWLVLRMVIHLQLFVVFGKTSDWKSFEKYAKISLGFCDSKGLFYDYPSVTIGRCTKERAFPLTYSYKMLALMMETYDLLHTHQIKGPWSKRINAVIERALPAHIAHILPSGEALYYGRSDNTLFGYANVLTILRYLKGSETLSKQVEQFVEKQFVGKGKTLRDAKLPLDAYRDPYIYDSVYCTYFYAQFMTLDQNKYWAVPEIPIVLETSAGFVIRDNSNAQFVSSSGCTFPRKGEDFNGYRYYGLMRMAFSGEPFLLTSKKIQQQLSSLQVEIKVGSLLFSPFCCSDITLEETSKEYRFNGTCYYSVSVSTHDKSLLAKVLRKLLYGRSCFSQVLGKLLSDIVGFIKPVKRTVVIRK